MYIYSIKIIIKNIMKFVWSIIYLILYDVVNNWPKGPEIIIQKVTYFQQLLTTSYEIYYLRVDTSPILWIYF